MASEEVPIAESEDVEMASPKDKKKEKKEKKKKKDKKKDKSDTEAETSMAVEGESEVNYPLFRSNNNMQKVLQLN